MPEEQRELFPSNVEQAVGDSFMDRQISSGMSSPDNKLIEFLVNDRSIPKKFRRNTFWAFSDKEMAITNFEKKDIQKEMLSLSIANKFYMMSKPDYDHSWEDEIAYSNMRAKFFAKTRRAIDGFERKMQVSQIRDFHSDAGKQRGSGGIVNSITSGFSKMFGGR